MERKRFSWLLNAVILTAFIAIGGFLGHSVLVIGSVLFNGSQYQVLPDQSILRLDFISTPWFGSTRCLRGSMVERAKCWRGGRSLQARTRT